MKTVEDNFDYIFDVRPYKVSQTKSLPSPNEYALALLNDYPKHALDEEKVLEHKGKWIDGFFGKSKDTPLDLEIGTGNGFHFANYVQNTKGRCIIGLELKYKPLIQTVRRALEHDNKDFVVGRYDARVIGNLFEKNELDNVYIHFPDPWAKKAATLKHRLVQVHFLNTLFEMQKPGSFVDFKTDHPTYYLCVKESLKHTNYKVVRDTDDLHASEWAEENFQTHFEKLWTSKGLKSHYIRFVKSDS